jgi:hypothetical protein
MSWLWLAVAAYWIAVGVFAWALRAVIPTAILAACWPWFAGRRVIAL